MNMATTFWRRIKYWLRSRREQAGIDEEMRLHLALRAERLRDAGMNGADAIATAQRRFGNRLQLRETSREMWINMWLDDFLRDVQIGSRGLARNPGFTIVAVLTIALGLGANTAIFSVIHTVLLKPLPYPNADQIVQISRVSAKEGGHWANMSGAQMLYIRDHAAAFRSVGAIDMLTAGFSLTGAGEPERIPGSHISSGVFDTLGVAPVAGRVFTAAEDKPGTEDVAVISDGLWQRRFGGAESVLGARITLDGRPHTVVGVMPRGFLARGSTANEDVWVPLRMTFDPKDVVTAFLVAGRVRDGASLRDVNAELDRIARRLRNEFHDAANEGQSFAAVPYREFLVGDVKPALLVLAGAVGLVLLLACANVANLLLARAAGRQKEIAIRTAMGASGWRLLRQLLTESLLLSLSASGVGLLLAFLGMRALLRSLPESIPWSGEIGFDPPVLVFTLGLAILTGLVFGLAPAWTGSGIRIAETLKAASGRVSSGVSAGRLRSGLVGLEVAVSVVLLVGGALLMQSFVRLRNVRMGFDPSHVLTAKMPLQKYTNTASMMTFLNPMLERINSSPGVKSAATVTSLPLEISPQWEFEVEGRPDFSVDALIHAVSPLYMETMGIRLDGGRRFAARDTAAAQPVVIVNEAFVRKAFPNHGVALGQHVHLLKEAAATFHEASREIVGIVSDVREDADGLRSDPAPAAYIPQAQVSDAFGQLVNRFLPISLVVKAQGSPLEAVLTVKQIVLSLDPLQPVAEIRSMEDVVDRSTSRDRFNLTLMGMFAFTALVLASIGIYGVVSYAVSQRTQELGVRIALGASVLDVLRLVIGGGMFISMIGVAAGLAGAYALSQFLAQLLFSTKATDPMTFFFVAALMLSVAFLANLVPALRAIRVDPIRALRYE
jgi:putative ABC transport system permease protein